MRTENQKTARHLSSVEPDSDIGVVEENQTETVDSETEIVVSHEEQPTTEVNNSSETQEIGANDNKKPSRFRLIFTIMMITSLMGGAGVVYWKMGTPSLGNLIDFENNDIENPSMMEDQLMKLRLEVDALKQKVTLFDSLSQSVTEMKDENKLQGIKIENLQSSLKSEVESFYSESRRREHELADIRNKLSELANRTDQVSKADFVSLLERLKQIEHQQETQTATLKKKLEEALKKSKTTNENSPEVPVIKPAAKPVEKNVNTADKNTAKTITSIGHLRLEAINQFGAIYVAQLSDGLSGAIQVIEGDPLSTYRVVKIDNEAVTLKDPQQKLFRLIKG